MMRLLRKGYAVAFQQATHAMLSKRNHIHVTLNDHQLRELRQKFGDGEAEQGSPYRFFSSPPRGAVARALFPEAAARRKQFEEEGFVRHSIAIDPATFPIERFLGGAQVLVRGLLTGSDLESLAALTQSLIDGTLKPEGDYKGFRPDHFYTFWYASPPTAGVSCGR